MKADALTPRQLFDGNVHYEIPTFQRPYVWNEEDQWAPLWADVQRVADRVLRDEADGMPSDAGHFLGAVVYESKPPVVGDVTRHLVIDGQQRTTTLQLLIDAVHHVIEERGHEAFAEDLEGLILNRAKAFHGKPERFKLWPSRHDRAAFARAMDPSSPAVDEHRILSAHDFFRAQATAYLLGVADEDGEAPGGAEEQRVHALSSTLQHRLRVVAINLTGHDDAQVIFETLNDRGTPLLKADLIKNWVFQRGEAVGANVEQWPETHWIDFDDDWWREEISQGRHVRSRIDIFLQYWLTMRLKDEVITEQVFRVFVHYAQPRTDTATRAETLLSELRRDANTFRSFAQLSEDKIGGTFYSRVVETMELAATSPVLMWLLSENHQVPDAQVQIALDSIESWVIRRTLLRNTMKDVNKTMVAMLKSLEGVEPEQAGHRVRDFLAVQTAEARLWPTDEEVAKVLPGLRLYGNIRQGRLRVVLEAVERHLRSAMHDVAGLPAGLEIEHVMPQAWRSHWDPEPKLSPEDAAARDRRVNVLGNLTLVTKKLNGSLSHRPWSDSEAAGLGTGEHAGKGKRSLLETYSLLVLTKSLVQQHPQAWTDEDVEKRSRDLALRIVDVWPGPPAEVDASLAALAAEDQVDDVLPVVDWTEDELREFALAAGSFMLGVLDLLAEHAGKRLDSDDFTQLGYTPHQAAGALGAIVTATRSKWARRNAPVRFAKKAGRWQYEMPEDLASLWNGVRGHAGE
jgi:hypothetical protein